MNGDTVLKDILWSGHFPLADFRKKIVDLKPGQVEGRRRVLIKPIFKLHLESVISLYTWIGFILKRMDIILSKSLEEEFPSQIHYLNIDIMSFIVFCHIMMDKIARLFDYLLWGQSKPKTRDFRRFKDDISNYTGNKLEDLKKIIEKISWYKEFDDVRDDPIVHKGYHQSALQRMGKRIGIILGHINGNGKYHENFYSDIEIKKLSINILKFLADINNFLCENFDFIPLEVKLKE